MKRFSNKVAFAAMVVALLAGIGQTTLAGDEYVINIGDKVAVSVQGEKELSGLLTVRADGKIFMPTVGEVAVSGVSEAQARERVTEALKGYIRHPVVTVVVQESSNCKVYVVGGGVKPAVLDVMQNKTLMQLLSGQEDLGGVDLEQASLSRNGQVLLKDFRPLFSPEGAQRDMALQPNDTVCLPPSAAKNVYVLGAVTTPRTLPFQEGMTVLEAILNTGGYNKFANPNSTRVIRREQGKQVIIKVKGKQLVQQGDLSQNVALRGGDVVIVDEGFF